MACVQSGEKVIWRMLPRLEEDTFLVFVQKKEIKLTILVYVVAKPAGTYTFIWLASQLVRVPNS